MAVTTQAQFRTHILAALKATIQQNPALLLPLLPGFIQYARTGADPREAIEMLLTTWWSIYAPTVPFQGHRLKHLLLDGGVTLSQAFDVIERAEP